MVMVLGPARGAGPAIFEWDLDFAVVGHLTDRP